MKKFLALLFIMPVLVNAQEKLLKKGNDYFALQQYNEALGIYLKIESHLVDSTAKYPILLQVASCYSNLHNPKQALRYFAAAYSLDNNFNEEQVSEFANALIQNGKYEDATSLLDKTNSGSFIDDILLSNCDYALKHPDVDRTLQIQAMKLQDGYSNYGMTLYNNRLLYIQLNKSKGSSDLKCHIVYQGAPDMTLKKLLDVDLPYNINSPAYDKANNMFYFSASASDLKKYTDSKREEEEIGVGGINNLFIYSANLKKGEFTPVKLPFNHIDYSCTHPFISADGQTIYFSSNMLGGYGGFDIYMAKKTASGWSAPVNMGKKINTVMNEGYPFVSGEFLYFSSDGHPGFGGLDIYRYNFETEEIENLDKPINSSFDDFSYIQLNPSEGYFSSNRNSNDGSDLIFHFKNSTSVQSDMQTQTPDENISFMKLNICTVNYYTSDTLPDIKLHITNSKGFQSDEETDISGKSLLTLPYGEYNVAITGENIVPDTLSILANSANQSITIQLKPDIDQIDKLTFRNIKFNFDKGTINDQSKVVLDKIAELFFKYPSLTAEIGGYTDSRGESTYNSIISELMAKLVMNYLVDKGIEENRLTAIGYGDSSILNQCVKGTDCTEAEHAYNKRIEMKFIK
jgi:outer membrane protein OmpA-like peptidoglycan-associated protein/tetratricopeptide (TPR) repeat protein